MKKTFLLFLPVILIFFLASFIFPCNPASGASENKGLLTVIAVDTSGNKLNAPFTFSGFSNQYETGGNGQTLLYITVNATYTIKFGSISGYTIIQPPKGTKRIKVTQAGQKVTVKAVYKKSGGSGSGGTSSAASEWTSAHNKWRDTVKTSHLTWSTELANYAQEWADYLKKSNSCYMEHRSNLGKNYKNTGENLAWNWSSVNPATAYTPTQVVNLWGNEVADYTYSSNSCKSGAQCGHYTQVIWSATTQVGCGKATCGNSWIYVCEYYPPGNYVGQKPY